MKFGMNQVQVPPFEPKLCHNVATASRNPLEPLLTPKSRQKIKKIRKIPISPYPPYSPYFPFLELPSCQLPSFL